MNEGITTAGAGKSNARHNPMTPKFKSGRWHFNLSCRWTRFNATGVVYSGNELRKGSGSKHVVPKYNIFINIPPCRLNATDCISTTTDINFMVPALDIYETCVRNDISVATIACYISPLKSSNLSVDFGAFLNRLNSTGVSCNFTRPTRSGFR